jgi:hypothetical protein
MIYVNKKYVPLRRENVNTFSFVDELFSTIKISDLLANARTRNFVLDAVISTFQLVPKSGNPMAACGEEVFVTGVSNK